MSTLQKQLKRFIKKQKLFDTKDPLLVAVSGGIDSVVLVHLLQSLHYSIAIAHCNFQLRGKASDEDADFVAQYAETLNLPYHEQVFDTVSYQSKHQLSTQEAARVLRYQWFEELIKNFNYKHLLTAHHANDQVETMLYHLTKGTGIAGLRGIPVKNDHIRRPLLFATREDIEVYAQTHSLQWREDLSNQEDKYSRNQIRHHVVPPLKQINPALEKTMLFNSQRFEALEQLLVNQVNQIKDDYQTQTKDQTSLSLEWLDQSNGSLVLLIELLKPFGFNSQQCLSIYELQTTNVSLRSGKQFFSQHYVLTCDRNSLEITTKEADVPFHLEISMETETLSAPYADFTLELAEDQGNWTQDSKKAYLDADLIKFPIKVRNWKQGDTFHPLGMRGKKKLSDFMIDEKIPVNLKSRVMLFESKEEIIWVAGHRINERYKITPQTRRVLIIKMTDHV